MATVNELDLAPPEALNRPLWKSLIRNFRDRFLPDQLPPLYLTSRPVNLGMLLGDFLGLPWYRTVFTNLGDVISPETQPPLQLESRPVDVGELIGDMVAHPWWSSLLRSLADSVAPHDRSASLGKGADVCFCRTSDNDPSNGSFPVSN